MAVAAEFGVIVNTNDRTLLKSQLYTARSQSENAALQDIVMIMSEAKDELWLVHRDADERAR